MRVVSPKGGGVYIYVMKTGDIVFVKGNGIVSRTIRLIDKGQFSHCAIIVKDNRVLEANVGIKSRIKYFDYKDYEILSINLSVDQINKLNSTCTTYIGRKYDYAQFIWLGLMDMIGLNIPRKSNDRKYLICSELVEDVLYDIGFIQKTEYLGNRSPNQLYKYLQQYSI